ncbi:phosphatase PAP2 family protein [Sediminispirochaeta smaragdinae]|jgi:undecaprenyl-diphosphatase|uniref:Phosphoesterase PA-phosphatase related protein n=1 Tax=Sediminispirochaeta smaragdinae (strain DSM 11293 / JCM 15392 / SEBR 4228) TaxID=573413 RepID=E1RCF8_SEDSS|nr:phosphatase PAP2 family protein [Sediminispirochaeta smaragdinae]ADK80038.1 phosphoesterase PA-phosphatase related protein [Sediminispirochaeta smaragdinae DSM 11293]
MQESILMAFQNLSTPFLDHLVELITMLGEETIMVVVLSWIYWNVSKEKGSNIVLLLLLSASVNGFLKLLFGVPRPYELLETIRAKRLETAAGYSFPSGHSQAAATFYFACAASLPERFRKEAVGCALAITALVALSRLYLGVHWPTDVAVGVILGILFALPLFFDRPSIFSRIPIIAVVLFTAGIVVASIDKSMGWNLKGVEAVTKSAGMLLGFAVARRLEQRFVAFECHASLSKKVIRFLAGMTTTLFLRLLLKLFIPENPIGDGLAYLIIGLWIAVWYPATAMKVSLFEKTQRHPRER